VRRLVERIELGPPAAGLDRRRPLTSRRARLCEPFEDRRQVASLAVGHRPLPLVERLAVAVREARHERPAVERRNLLERSHARVARFAGSVAVSADGSETRAEAADVHVPRPIERDRRPRDREPAPSETGVEDRERASERAPGRALVRVRPEQRRELGTGGRPVLDREPRQERGSLPRVDDEGGRLDLDLHRAQQANCQLQRSRPTVATP